MCRPTTCPNCNKSTWIGCGLHIPTAMSSIPKEEWCSCKHPSDSTTSKEYPPRVGSGIP